MKYRIIMKKNDFFKIHNRIAVKDLEIKDDEVNFEVELGSLNILKESGYPYHLVDSVRIKLQMFMKQYYLLIIGVVFLFSILYINSFRIDKIEFNMNTPINNTIEQRIKQSYKKIFCFNFSNLDYATFSKTLRLEYVEYPYIEVYSKNNRIKVDIYSYDDEYPNKNILEEYGNVVAKKDAIVDSFYVYSGNLLVGKNTYVKQGDILISGTINETRVSPKGLIMGYTYEKVTLDIMKKEEVMIETENQQSYYQLQFLNYILPIQKKDNYNECNKEENSIFNFFDLFCIKKIEEIEKNAIIKENDESSAIKQAENIIKDSFEENKTNKEEKIVDIKTYKVVEDENKYSITFILKKLESLGEFISD